MVTPVIVAGAAAVGLALFYYADAPRSATDVAGLFGLMASMAARRAVPRSGRRDGRRRRHPRLRLLRLRDHPARLAGGRARRRRRADASRIFCSAARRCASPTTARCSRSRRSRPGSPSSASTGTRSRSSSRKVVRLRLRLLLGRQPHPDQRGPRGELRPLVLHDREGEHHADDGAVRAHGLGGADADRPLAALSRSSRSRSSGRCWRSRSTSGRPTRRCRRCGSR